MSRIGTRYASALFEYAKELNMVDSWHEETQYIIKTIDENPELIGLLSNALIRKEDKKDTLNKIYGKSIAKEVLHFLYILVDKKRTFYLKDILMSFHSLCNEEKGIKEGIVYSVKKLDESEINKLEQALYKTYNSAISLINKIDLNLLSGIKVVVGDTVIDGSKRNQIDSLRNHLLKEGW